jgi:FlaA1/EpsC-like NDP-sugar epimerase
MTGPNQVAYVDEEDLLTGDPEEVYQKELLHAKLAVDLDYVRQYSMRRDISLLWQTLIRLVTVSERRSIRPQRRYTLSEKLASTRLSAVLLDAGLAALCAALAVGLRIDRNNLLAAVAAYWVFVPLAAVLRPAGFAIAGAYMRVWRYPTVGDGALIVTSLAAGSLVMTIAIFVVMQPWGFSGTVGFPRSAIGIELLLSVLVLGGIRLASRVRQEAIEDAEAIGPLAAGPPKPVIVYGAGQAGAALVREMRRNRALRLEPVAFLDDDATRRGQHLYGVEVAGAVDDLARVVAERGASEVIVAQPRIGGDRLRRIVAVAEALGVTVRTLPAVFELLDETVSVSRVRPVRVEDLIRRQPADLPEEPMRELISGKRILVTGAGGSIGSELCRQICALSPSQLVLFERAETPLFYIDEELRRRYHGVTTSAVIGDVTDDRVVRKVFERERPEVVFHAAAQKHVPLSEANVSATVWTNVRGTRVVATMAAEIGVDNFTFISTDKAVDPTSVMGATKFIGEWLVREIGDAARGSFVIVRFGNVLGSQGSVLELFRQQIEDGGPLTVTHPAMTRYFMTIPEAVRLILHAGSVGTSGDVHVLNMGEPIRIVDLARDLIRLSAPTRQQDIEIAYTGLRAGEKLEECLFSPNEQEVETGSPFLLIARPKVVSEREASATALRLERLAREGRDVELRDLLLATAAHPHAGLVQRP